MGKIMGIYYTLFLLMFSIILLATLVEILNTTMFSETPTFITAVIMLITCTYISYKGLEGIARGGGEIFFFHLLFFFHIFICSIKL